MRTRTPLGSARAREAVERRSPRTKRREFERLRRRIERELFFWVGHRYGYAPLCYKDASERERLEQCETAGDFVHFYLNTATPTKNWADLPPRERWNWFRREASPIYHNAFGHAFKDEGELNRTLTDLRNLLDLDPGVIPDCLP